MYRTNVCLVVKYAYGYFKRLNVKLHILFLKILETLVYRCFSTFSIVSRQLYGRKLRNLWYYEYKINGTKKRLTACVRVIWPTLTPFARLTRGTSAISLFSVTTRVTLTL